MIASSRFIVKDSNDEVVLTVVMKDGEINIEAKSHAASTNIRFETIGLSFTTRNITTSTETKGYSGPGSVSSAGATGDNVLLFKNGVKTDEDPVNGIVTTTIKFNTTQVSKALSGETFEGITKGTKIYMHGIFRTYDYDTDTTRSGNSYLKNWEDIMNAEWWGSNTLGDFIKYYNMEIEFMPATQENTLYYITDNKEEIGNKALDTGYIGDTVDWDNELIEKPYKNKTYTL